MACYTDELTAFLYPSQVEIEDLTRQNTELHTLITEYNSTPSEEELDQESSLSPNGNSASEGELSSM